MRSIPKMPNLKRPASRREIQWVEATYPNESDAQKQRLIRAQRLIVYHNKLSSRVKTLARPMLRAMAGAKKNAFSMARQYLDMRENHLAELQEKLGKQSIDQWLAESFAPLRKLNGNHIELIAAVEAGMSEADYLAEPNAAVPQTWALKIRNRRGRKD